MGCIPLEGLVKPLQSIVLKSKCSRESAHHFFDMEDCAGIVVVFVFQLEFLAILFVRQFDWYGSQEKVNPKYTDLLIMTIQFRYGWLRSFTL